MFRGARWDEPLGYVGAPFDPEGELVHFHARYYAPALYRFPQRDSLFGTAPHPVSLHRYAYAQHNPLAYHDPTGHWVWPHWGYPGWGLDQLGGTILLEGGPAPGECWNTGLTCAQMQAWALNAPAELGGLGGGGLIGSGAIISAVGGSGPFNWARANTLARHFRNHGPDFGAATPADYARLASEFLLESQRRGLPTLIDSSGVIRVYDPSRNWFASYNPDGTTRTFFVPTSPTYWERNAPYWGNPPWIP